MRVIPLYRSDAALVNQRKLALYGVRMRTIPEDDVEAKLKKEFSMCLSEVFNCSFRCRAFLNVSHFILPAETQTSMPKQMIAKDSVFRTAARYEKIRVVKWIMPKVRKYLA